MFELKTLSREAIPRSLAKAEHYRLLNEPTEAESICLDILQIDPDDQRALITLLLSLTDQFSSEFGLFLGRIQELLPRIRGEYEKAYYAGLVCERRAKARLHQGGPGARSGAYQYFREAMIMYEKAEALSPPDNDDATLRWNTCARIMMRNHLQAEPEDRIELPLE
jgi:hypothetical protein